MKSYLYPYLAFGESAALRRATLALALFLTLGCPARAQGTPAQNLSDLTLSNFFTAGWDQDWAHRSNPDGAPDMALLRVSTNFLEREFRTDFFTQQDVNSPKNRDVNLADALVAYGLDRRFMLSVTSNYQWINSRVNNDVNASSTALGARFQLIDIPGSSYALNLKVTSPAKAVSNDLSTIAYGLAGWEDLTPYGLKRVGLYFSVQGDNYVGPHIPGAKDVDVACDVTLAKTWTAPTGTLQNFTTFAELYGTTDLDGATSGKTVVTATRCDLTMGYT